jgi:hypothetical protein
MFALDGPPRKQRRRNYSVSRELHVPQPHRDRRRGLHFAHCGTQHSQLPTITWVQLPLPLLGEHEPPSPHVTKLPPCGPAHV